jgi:ribonuclease HII
LLQKILNKEHDSLKTLIAAIGHKHIKVVIDGKYDFKLRNTLHIEVETIVDGDAKIPQIGMASILAKVERDREMIQIHKKYPKYGFDKHKGYGTQIHRDRILQYGPCKIHRKSFLKKLYHSDNQQQLFS